MYVYVYVNVCIYIYIYIYIHMLHVMHGGFAPSREPTDRVLQVGMLSVADGRRGTTYVLSHTVDIILSDR